MSSPIALSLSALSPGQITLPRIVGAAVEGGTSLSGAAISSDATGGGLVAVDYSNLQVGNSNQERLRFWSLIATAGPGSRLIIVPLMTDWIAPVDKSQFASPTVSGAVSGAQVAGSATISVSLIGGTGVLNGGEWFGLVHPTAFQRAYVVTDIDSTGTDGSGNPLFTVGIRPTLRDAIADGAPVTWWRPQCMMRLAPGFDPKAEMTRGFWSTPSLSFIEAAF